MSKPSQRCFDEHNYNGLRSVKWLAWSKILWYLILLAISNYYQQTGTEIYGRKGVLNSDVWQASNIQVPCVNFANTLTPLHIQEAKGLLGVAPISHAPSFLQKYR